MTDENATPEPRPQIPDPALSRPPGAFVDSPGAPPGQPLPPGAGSPVAPGPAMSVSEPIKDTTLNMGALVLFAVLAVLAIIVIAILIAVLHH